MEFFNRSKGTILENNFNVLFNLYLVLHKQRPAFLFETANFNSIEDAENAMKIIEKKYTEFKKTIEDDGNSNVPRYFYHIENLPDKKNISHTTWVGKALGFKCPGDIITIDRYNNIYYSITYILVTPTDRYEIYTELCEDKQNISTLYLKSLEQMKQIANKLNYDIELRIKKNIPKKLFLQNVKDKNIKWLEDNRNDFIDFLDINVEMMEDIIDWNTITIKELLDKYYRYILFYSFISANEDPFDILYPLSIKENNSLIKLRKNLFQESVKNNTEPSDIEIKTLNSNIIQKILEKKNINENEILNKINIVVDKLEDKCIILTNLEKTLVLNSNLKVDNEILKANKLDY